MAWIYLLLAGIMEVGWPVGLKMAQQPESRILGIIIAVSFMAASGFLLWLAQKTIPIGTSYAIWTSIGAVGTFLVGIWFYGDTASLGKYFGMLLVISGVVGSYRIESYIQAVSSDKNFTNTATPL